MTPPAPHRDGIEHDLTNALGHRDFGTHAVGPECVDLSGSSSAAAAVTPNETPGATVPGIGAISSRPCPDRYPSSTERASPDDPWRRTDVQALQCLRIAQRNIQILSAQQGTSTFPATGRRPVSRPPFRKSGKCRMGGTANEIDCSVAQRLVGIVNGEDQLIGHVETFFEEAPVDGAGAGGRNWKSGRERRFSWQFFSHSDSAPASTEVFCTPGRAPISSYQGQIQQPAVN